MMQSKIEIIKDSYTIEKILDDYSSRFSIRETRNGFSITDCPFCGSKEKLWINTELQICNCFKCGSQAMDVINFFAKIYHMSNNAAITVMFELLLEEK